MKSSLMVLLASVFTVAFSTAKADTIKFPDEELATESVLPLFENAVSVKNRTVQTAKRFELGLMGGMSLNEPFASPFSMGGEVTYHMDEDQAINVYGTYFLNGNTHYVTQINDETQHSGVDTNLSLQNAPHPKYLLIGSYQLTLFYGKLSLTKNYIMNLGTYVDAGAGGFMIGDALEPVVSAGFGQKFYFSPNFALRFDLRLLVYQGPNPITPGATHNSTGEVSSSKFEKRLFTNSLLSVGAVYLIPNS